MEKSKSTIIGAIAGFFFAYLVICLIDQQIYCVTDAFLFGTPGAILGALIGFACGKKGKTESAESVQTQPVVEKKDLTEDLLNYKKLLDAGIITKEEFAKKKDEILKNI